MEETQLLACAAELLDFVEVFFFSVDVICRHKSQLSNISNWSMLPCCFSYVYSHTSLFKPA